MDATTRPCRQREDGERCFTNAEAADMPELWLIDRDETRVHVFGEPSGGRCETQSEHGGDDRLSPLAFPDMAASLSMLKGG